jgi:hypothetical protein
MGEREATAASGRDAAWALPLPASGKYSNAIGAALADTSTELGAHMKMHTESEDIGNRLLQRWEQGVALSLKVA